MGYWYWRQLKNNMALTQAATNRFNFPEKGYVSGLLVHEASTNATCLTTYDNEWNIMRSKIRLVGNGNYEIVNAEARHLAAMNFLETKHMPNLGLANLSGGVHSFDELIQFGRYLGDPTYGLILDKFAAGVQFEETNTFASAYYTSGSDQLTVWALMCKDPPAGMFGGGFFKKRQIITKDGASEVQYAVKLPTQNKLKQIHLFSEEDISSNVRSASFGANGKAIWLGVKSREEYILDNIGMTQMSRLMANYFGLRARTKGYVSDAATAGVKWETCIHDLRESTAIPYPAVLGQQMQESQWTWLDSIAFVRFTDAAGTASTGNGMISNEGLALFGQVPLLMVDPLAPETEYLDAKALADVYVEFTEGNSTCTHYIVLDELEKIYPT